MAKVNIRKAAMIGCGFVGSSSAFALMQSGLFSEMVMIDANKEKAEGEAMDIAHGLPFARPIELYAGTYDDIVDAAIIIITAGASQKPNETRLDLIHKNVEIFKSQKINQIIAVMTGSFQSYFYFIRIRRTGLDTLKKKVKTSRIIRK